ncbi:MAG TPA: ABC transporter permease, partial [Candidatus Omnitrophota bacterium]|nr:ABC transporter permease [Candidatus Omnitrophota bacterium]
MTHPIAVVFAKETRDNLRDRRSLLSALIYPLLGPLVIAAMLFYLSNVVANRDAVGVTLPVMGAEHAPGLVERLTGQGYRIVPAPADVEAA